MSVSVCVCVCVCVHVCVCVCVYVCTLGDNPCLSSAHKTDASFSSSVSQQEPCGCLATERQSLNL